jgi:response regulator RpfG family c-di-GMP phosphodiesterase
MAKPSSLAREPSDRRERVRKARRFALKILKGSDAGVFVCHTPRRAARIAAACRMIGRHDRLEKEALAGVEIAAWLHELGFVQTPHKAVEGSLVLAKAFLEKYRYAPESVEIILDCIRAAHNENVVSRVLWLPHSRCIYSAVVR